MNESNEENFWDAENAHMRVESWVVAKKNNGMSEHEREIFEEDKQ